MVLYPDGDGDGVGTSPRSVQCLGASLPPGWSVLGWDLDDGNAAVHWNEEEEEDLLVLLL